jgi:hypothetical protein
VAFSGKSRNSCSSSASKTCQKKYGEGKKKGADAFYMKNLLKLHRGTE